VISELGASGAPHAFVFNFFGFIVPGLLIVALAVGLKREFCIICAPSLLGLCGAFLAIVGLFPLKFGANYIHVIAAHLCGLAFVVAAVLLSIPMRKNPRFIQLSRLTPAFVFLLILNVACALAWAPQGLIPPGWSQRFNLVGYFFWLTFAGLSLLSSFRKKRPVRHYIRRSGLRDPLGTAGWRPHKSIFRRERDRSSPALCTLREVASFGRDR
jgi:hypothetical membrane protein